MVLKKMMLFFEIVCFSNRAGSMIARMLPFLRSISMRNCFNLFCLLNVVDKFRFQHKSYIYLYIYIYIYVYIYIYKYMYINIIHMYILFK